MKTLKEEVMELLMKRIGVAEGEEFEASTVGQKFRRKYTKKKF